MERRANFIKHVKQKPRIRLWLFWVIIVLYVVILVGINSFKIIQDAELNVQLKKEEALIAELKENIKPKIVNSEGKVLVAITGREIRGNSKGFYPLLNELSNVVVKGVWVNSILLDLNKGFLKINGGTYSTEFLDQFFELLKQQGQLGAAKYEGLSVSPGTLPELPYDVRALQKDLVIPEFYEFIIQTAPISKQKKSLQERYL